MINKRVMSVIKREIKVSMGKSFVIATILIPIVMFATSGIQYLVSDIKTVEPSQVILVTEPGAPFEQSLRDEIKGSKDLADSKIQVEFASSSQASLDKLIDARREKLLDDDNMGIVFVPSTAPKDKKIAFYSANPANANVRQKVGDAVNKALNRFYFDSNGVRDVDIALIQQNVAMSGNKISRSGTQAESWGPLIIGGTLALLLLFGVSFNSMPVMSMVVSEKSSRVYEVLLCSLKPLDLLWGKIIGKTLVATLQMLIWVAAMAAVVVMLNNFTDMSDAFRMEFRPMVFAYYVVNYVVGLMTFLALYVGFSVGFEDQAKANSALLPVYFAILIPFYTVFSLVNNPANTASEILSMVPLTSLYVMPARMSLIEVPFWQPIVALLLNMVVLYVAMIAASRLYRLSILSTGNSPSLRQLVIWARKAD